MNRLWNSPPPIINREREQSGQASMYFSLIPTSSCWTPCGFWPARERPKRKRRKTLIKCSKEKWTAYRRATCRPFDSVTNLGSGLLEYIPEKWYIECSFKRLLSENIKSPVHPSPNGRYSPADHTDRVFSTWSWLWWWWWCVGLAWKLDLIDGIVNWKDRFGHRLHDKDTFFTRKNKTT